jgi:leucyl aminopeptidase (aminopeptidase T)
MYLPWWVLAFLALFIATVAYEAGAKNVRTAWRKQERERRERRRQRKRDRRQARIRAQYGEDLDDEAVSMIYDIERDDLLSPDSKNLAINFELLENHRRMKEQRGATDGPE